MVPGIEFWFATCMKIPLVVLQLQLFSCFKIVNIMNWNELVFFRIKCLCFFLLRHIKIGAILHIELIHFIYIGKFHLEYLSQLLELDFSRLDIGFSHVNLGSHHWNLHSFLHQQQELNFYCEGPIVAWH